MCGGSWVWHPFLCPCAHLPTNCPGPGRVGEGGLPPRTRLYPENQAKGGSTQGSAVAPVRARCWLPAPGLAVPGMQPRGVTWAPTGGFPGALGRLAPASGPGEASGGRKGVQGARFVLQGFPELSDVLEWSAQRPQAGVCSPTFWRPDVGDAGGAGLRSPQRVQGGSFPPLPVAGVASCPWRGHVTQSLPVLTRPSSRDTRIQYCRFLTNRIYRDPIST